jgi:hypothetical protein
MIDKMAFEQLRTETATKQAQNVSYNDPNTLSSEGARDMLDKAVPGLRKKMGEAKWSQITKAFVAANYPNVDKLLEAETKKLEKEQERTSREGIAKGHDQTAVDVANIRANAKGGGSGGGAGGTIKTGDVQKGIMGAQTIDKQLSGPRDNLTKIDKSLRLLDEADKLLPNVKTDPVTGRLLNNAVGDVVGGPDRQRLRQITQELAVGIQELQKGTQTESDIQRYNQIVDMLSKDDPSQGIKAARETLTEKKSNYETALTEGELSKKRMLQTTGLVPKDEPAAPTAPAQAKGGEMVPMVNAQGRKITIPFNRVKEAEADGFRRQ